MWTSPKWSYWSWISHWGNVTLESGSSAHDNNRVVLFFYVRNIYFKAFVKYELQEWRDGLAVDSFHTVSELSVHLRVSLLV